MMYDPFNVLLSLVVEYFVEAFYMNSSEILIYNYYYYYFFLVFLSDFDIRVMLTL